MAAKKAADEASNSALGHNWIAISASNYERQIPLISAILKGDEGKEVKLKISSKVRKQFYPKNWTIIQVNMF